jgi:hypothetical protein
VPGVSKNVSAQAVDKLYDKVTGVLGFNRHPGVLKAGVHCFTTYHWMPAKFTPV